LSIVHSFYALEPCSLLLRHLARCSRELISRDQGSTSVRPYTAFSAAALVGGSNVTFTLSFLYFKHFYHLVSFKHFHVLFSA